MIPVAGPPHRQQQKRILQKMRPDDLSFNQIRGLLLQTEQLHDFVDKGHTDPSSNDTKKCKKQDRQSGTSHPPVGRTSSTCKKRHHFASAIFQDDAKARCFTSSDNASSINFMMETINEEYNQYCRTFGTP